jgi:hypothetical protein
MKHNQKRYEEIAIAAMQGLLANPAFTTMSRDDIAIQASEISYAMLELFDNCGIKFEEYKPKESKCTDLNY